MLMYIAKGDITNLIKTLVPTMLLARSSGFVANKFNKIYGKIVNLKKEVGITIKSKKTSS